MALGSMPESIILSLFEWSFAGTTIQEGAICNFTF